MTDSTATGSARRARRLRERFAHTVAWTPPTSTEIGTVVKSGLAAGLSWAIARVVTGVPDPVLAALTSIVVVQVAVRASLATALQRSAAVVLGVLLALAIGDAMSLNGLTVGLIVAVSLAVAELGLRLPRSAARQVPISGLVVLSAVAAAPGTSGWRRASDAIVGAAVGVVVSLTLPASRLVDGRQTLDRLARSLGGLLETMGSGLQQPWSIEQTKGWRREARTIRERLVAQATEAVGNGRDAARWNMRDRRHIDELGRYEDTLPRLERTAIGVSVISRGLDDQAHLTGAPHPAMAAMGRLLTSLGGAVRTVVGNGLGDANEADVAAALALVRAHRARCVQGASRRAKLALEHGDDAELHLLEGEWLGYAAILVQLDRIVGDLSAPLPT